jgi:hypothetical protein
VALACKCPLNARLATSAGLSFHALKSRPARAEPHRLAARLEVGEEGGEGVVPAAHAVRQPLEALRGVRAARWCARGQGSRNGDRFAKPAQGCRSLPGEAVRGRENDAHRQARSGEAARAQTDAHPGGQAHIRGEGLPLNPFLCSLALPLLLKPPRTSELLGTYADTTKTSWSQKLTQKCCALDRAATYTRRSSHP